MYKNLIPTINISAIINGDFNSNRSINTINKIKYRFFSIYWSLNKKKKY